MIVLWIAAFLALAAAAAMVLLYSARPVAVVSDPAQTVYLRQLSEIDELLGRGLMGEDEHALAKAEAARRALKEKGETAEVAPTKAGRMAVVAAIGVTGLLALGLYLAVGEPGMPDQPFKRRLEAWRAEPLETLAPGQIRALLEEKQAEAGGEPEFLRLLAQMQADSGDDLSAIRNLEKALAIDPNSAQGWSMLGQLRARLAEGEVTPAARQALERALALDPASIAPRYLIGKSEIESGQRAQGVARWRAMLPELNGEQRATLEAEIAQAEGAVLAAGPNADPAIMAMVDRLASRLKENPGDVAGWARLVRSYKVLGDEAKLAGALTEARTRFKGDDLATIEAAVDKVQ